MKKIQKQKKTRINNKYNNNKIQIKIIINIIIKNKCIEVHLKHLIEHHYILNLKLQIKYIIYSNKNYLPKNI